MLSLQDHMEINKNQFLYASHLGTAFLAPSEKKVNMKF